MVLIHTTLLRGVSHLDKDHLPKEGFLRQVYSTHPEQNVSLMRSFFSDAKPEIECAFNWSLRCFYLPIVSDNDILIYPSF